METRVHDHRALILPGLFTLLCVVLTIVAYTVVGGALPFAAQGYQITIPFPEAANLVPGSDVEIAGVTIGKVTAVNRSGTRAAVTVRIDPAFVPIRAGATAIERTKTLLGEGYIQLAPGPAGARPIPDGGTLARVQVRSRVALDQFVSTFDPATRERLRRLMGGLAGAFGNRATELSNTLGWSAPLTGSLGQLLGTVAGQRAQLGRLVAKTGEVMLAIGRRQGAVDAAVTGARDVLGATAAQHAALGRAVTALAPLLAQLHTTSDAITVAAPVLNRAVVSLQPAAALLEPALAGVERTAPPIRDLFAALPATLAAGRRDLPAVHQIVHAARGAFAQFYPTARELIPFMQLFGSDRQIVRVLANVGSTLGGTYVGPGGTVLDYLNAVPTFWNESISGWAHKLPTNRQNPYPASPEALLETGQLGVLKSYDCRNTGNPLWLPPFGAAPPCILQGPFTFDGRSAYYPHLTLAAP